MEIIRVENLKKNLEKRTIFENVNFSIEKGEIVALIGPSGSGKSVLIKTLIGFYKPDSGKVMINTESKNPIGFSMQNNSIYDNLTVIQNMRYFSKIYGLTKEEMNLRIPILLERLEIQKFENFLIKNISGGTKKRVDLACALLNDPEIIILDEPLLGLDPALVKNLLQFILSLNNAGKTIIISSHILEGLSLICSRVFFIKNKEVTEIKKSEITKVYQ